MLNSAWRAAICAMTGVGLTLAAVPSASADDPVVTPCADRTICTSDHGSSTAPGTGGGGTSGGGGGGGSTCTWQGHEVPCWIDDRGAFSAGCYYIKSQPQPLGTEAVWGTHTAKDGAIYDKSCILDDGFVPSGQVFLAQPVAAPPPKTPRQLAWEALQTITVGDPVLRAAPGTDAVVGSPVWFWLDPAKDVTGPLSSSPLQGDGFSVVTTITLKQVIWTVDSGPGEPPRTFICQDTGTVFSTGGTPTCSHLFTRSSAGMKDKAYTLNVQLEWNVTARKDGTTAVDTTNMGWTTTGTRTLQVPVNEVQVLN
ncbi:hypothetical protein EDD39_5644 [Kitasatospora cineracea]|uniref:ATP/GTP-binding protein n=2 Tax=Kitasatospora cineracea TaxID=88074 RepID=A0A8G1UB56_9ACTN|nr:hypothetical protein EDD39_5644 [Kitasatospora cineracea]